MSNLDIYNSSRSVPEEAKKTIQAGRTKGFTDINPMWRIKKLTELFGPCGIGWYYEVSKEWTETVNNETCAFVDINLYIKMDGEWSKPIHGTGGSKLSTVEKSGIYVSDECFKMATTDAISVSCKQLGIGADVYFAKDRTKYDSIPEEEIPTHKTELQRYCEDNGLIYEKVLAAYKVPNESYLTSGQMKAIQNKDNHKLFKETS